MKGLYKTLVGAAAAIVLSVAGPAGATTVSPGESVDYLVTGGNTLGKKGTLMLDLAGLEKKVLAGLSITIGSTLGASDLGATDMSAKLSTKNKIFKALKGPFGSDPDASLYIRVTVAGNTVEIDDLFVGRGKKAGAPRWTGTLIEPEPAASAALQLAGDVSAVQDQFIPSVPLPASGLVLLSALGAVSLMRGRSRRA